MSAKHFRIIALQSVFALFVFLLFVYFFVKYDSEQLQNQVNNMGQTLDFAIEVDVNTSKGVLASFAYNYEIDPDLDVAKFETLAKHYIKVNPEIIYVQRKDKETTTVMVYPDTYSYTLGATLMGRPEVEEAVRKAIKDKIVTANAPYVLKDSEDLLGLVIRYPLYKEEIFNGFIVVVMNIDNLLNNIIDAEMMTDYNISLIDDNEKLFWGYDGQHKGHVYINNIAILDNFWTIQVSMKDNMMASTIGFLTGTSFLFLLIVGLLVVMQIRLMKKDQNNQQLAISKEELENRLLQSVNAISKIGELRDVYTASHQKKVADLSCAIGREMGLKDEKIRNLSFGSLLHDVGKFFVPSEILNKPGKMTDLEYQIIQTHVDESYNVVKEIDFPKEIHTMVYQHHERLDGSGYPLGISGDEIILESRILAVADVVEAMTSHRPYRAALGIDAALKEILFYRGTKYDAEVVDVCVKLFKEDGYTISSS